MVIQFLLIIFLAFKAHCLDLNSRIGDSLALVDLYKNLNGINWTGNNNWNDGTPINQWTGVIVNNDRVDSLTIEELQLIGSVPSTINQLSELTFLYLSNNSLDGGIDTLPPQIGDLNKLKTLYISTSSLQTIPTQIHNLTNLEHLQIRLVDQYGFGIDYSLFPKLKSLSTSDTLRNSYESLSDLVDLEWVYLEFCFMEGLPSRIEEWVNLDELWIGYNSLSMADLEYVYSLGIPNLILGNQILRGDTLYENLSEITEISIPIEGSQNKYIWYKDGIVFDSISNSNSIEIDSPGKYKAVVTSDSIVNITVEYSPIIVDISVSNNYSLNLKNKKVSHYYWYNSEGVRVYKSHEYQPNRLPNLDKGVYFVSTHGQSSFKVIIP